MTATAPHCHACGTHLLPNDRFCSGCGTRVDGLTPPPSLPPDDPLLEQLRRVTLGLYDVHSELGRGGMAAVYLAHDLRLHRKVAIKVMLPELFLSEGMADRFLLEARTAARLSHPNIVVIHAVSSADDLFYFVMSLVEGGAVDDILNVERPLPVDETKWVLSQAARALYHAHIEGVVHRDVKPANIMINLRGDVVLTDFGIAKASESPHLTRTGMVIGTPAYMSPEQIMAASITSASDQYSLGIVAYELLTGQPPFLGSALEVQWAHVHTAAPDLALAAPWVPADLAATVMRMLAKNPEARWESLEVLGDIFVDGLPGSGGRTRQALALRAQGTRRGPHSPTPKSPVPNVPQSSPRPAAPPRRATRLRLTPSTLELEAGDDATLAVSAHDDEPTTEPGGLLQLPDPVKWQSDNEPVATVTPDGRVTAHAPGRMNVHVTAGPLSSTCDLTVVPAAVARLVVSEATLSLTVREQRALSATAYDRRDNVTMARTAFASADHTIVRVDEQGTVEAVAPGTTTITVSSGATRRVVAVTVTAVPLRDIRISPTQLSLVTGRSAALDVEATDMHGDSAPAGNVSWTSQQRSIATVTSGVLQAHAPGVTVVSARVGVLTSDVWVQVTAPVPARVVIAAPAPVLRVSRTARLETGVFEADGTAITGVPVEWTSENEAVATVDATGNVRAVAVGRAEIVGTVGPLSAVTGVEVLAPRIFPVKPVAVGAAALLVGVSGWWMATRTDVPGNEPSVTANFSQAPVAASTGVTGDSIAPPGTPATPPGQPSTTQLATATGAADTVRNTQARQPGGVTATERPAPSNTSNQLAAASRDTARRAGGSAVRPESPTTGRPAPATKPLIAGVRPTTGRVPVPPPTVPPAAATAAAGGSVATGSVEPGKPPASPPELPRETVLTVAQLNSAVGSWLKAHRQAIAQRLRPNARNGDLATRLNRLDARKFNQANGCQVESSEPQGNGGRVVIGCPSLQSGGNPGTVLVTLQVVLNNGEVGSAEIVSDVVFRRRD